MISYYKTSLVELFAKAHQLHSQPEDGAELSFEIQRTLIQRIVYVERRIRTLKREVKEYKGLLANRPPFHLSKLEASQVKSAIEYNMYRLDEYQHLLGIFRSVADAIAFTYIDRWEIKPMTFKESPGFLSGKVGLAAERKVLKEFFASGSIAILNDLTNCLRYGDITVIDSNGFRLVEVKSTKNRNDRTDRQLSKAQKITEYLATDRSRNLLEGQAITRSALRAPEQDQIDHLNELIYEAIAKGESGATVEDGLYYIVTFKDSGTQGLESVIRKCCAPPIVYYLNMIKYNNIGYYPFTLSIRDPNALYAFYNGDLLISVIIDPSVVINRLGARGLSAMLSSSEDWALQVKATNKIRSSTGEMTISHYLFARLALEFLSLSWFLDEVTYRFSRLSKSRGNAAEQLPLA